LGDIEMCKPDRADGAGNDVLRGRSIVEESILSAAARSTDRDCHVARDIVFRTSRAASNIAICSWERAGRPLGLPVKDCIRGMSVHSICSLLQFAAVIQKLTERFGVI
jgi:hypothetical protein